MDGWMDQRNYEVLEWVLIQIERKVFALLTKIFFSFPNTPTLWKTNRALLNLLIF